MRQAFSTIFLFLAWICSVHAQSQSVRATIRVIQVLSTENAPGESDDYHFKFWLNGAQMGSCLTTSNNGPNQWINVNYSLIANKMETLSSTFTLETEAWEEDGCGEVCNYNDRTFCDDNLLCSRAPGGIQPVSFNAAIGGNAFSLGQFPPGNSSSNMIEIWYCGGRYRIRLLVTYTMPDPASISVSQNEPNTLPCGNGDLTLHTSVATGFIDQVNFAWSYQIFTGRTILGEIPNPSYCGDQFQCVQDPEFPQPLPGCCFEPPTIPGEVPEVISGSLPPTNAAINNGSQTVVLRSLPGFQNMTQKGSIIFFVRAIANSSSSGPAFSNAQFLDPPAPLVTGTITTSESCNRATGKRTGTINVAGVIGMGSYKYNLRPGHNNNSPCDPLDPDNPCFSGTVSGSTSGLDFSIINVPPGNFTLWLANEGGDVGVCFSTNNITVGELPELSLFAPSITNLVCYQQPDGQIQLQYAGGKGPYDFALNGQPTNQTGLFTGLAANSYDASVTDQCLQVKTQTVVVRQPAKVDVASSIVSAATCNSPANGRLALTVTETNGPFDISASSNFRFRILKGGNQVHESIIGTTTFLSPNLEIGNDYEYVIQEENGQECNGSRASFQILAPPSLGVVAIPTQTVSCAGLSDGKIQLTGSGGSNSFRYELLRVADNQLSSSPSGEFTGLREGNYTYTVFNNNPGCTDQFTAAFPVYLDEPDPLTVSFDPKNITCSGAGNGSITADVSGGTPLPGPGNLYNYSWQVDFGSGFSGIGTNANAIFGLDSATYRLRITDRNNCPLMSNTVKILEPPPLVIDNVIVNDIRCLGETGSVTINTTGGTPGYTFETSADAGNSFQALAPLPAGSYRVRVRDVNNCLTADPGIYTITDPPGTLTFTTQKRVYNGGYNISCFGGNNGEVTLTATGGNGPGYSGYEFAVGSGPFGSNNVLIGLTTAPTPVKVRDDRGCEVSQIINDLTQAPAITTVTSRKENVECFGAATGVLELTVGGGVGPFTFQNGPSPVQPLPLFNNLVAGTYTISITDANNCTVSYQDDVINLNPPLSVTPTITHAQCFNTASGSIGLAVAGGAAPYRYELGATTVNNPVTQLRAGSYRVAIIDTKGCRQETTDLIVNQPDSLMITSVLRNDIVCFGGTGSITMAAAGGTGTYQYQYSINAQPFVNFTGATPLTANRYRVQVRDANGCVTPFANEIEITTPPAALDFTFALSDYDGFNVSCFGGNNGSATIAPTGGNGSTYAGYLFAVNTLPYQAENLLGNLVAGPHTLFVRDARGCVTSKNISLTQASVPFTASIANQVNVACYNDTNGQVTLATSGGIAPFSFRNGSAPAQTSPQFMGLGVGSYTFNVFDKYNCNTSVATTIISTNPELLISASAVPVKCFGGTDGSVSVAVTGGTSPYAYAWTGQSPTSSTLTNVTAGSYTATVTDQTGCKISVTSAVTQPAAPLQIASINSLASCFDQANGGLTLNTTGGTPPYRFSVNNGTSFQGQNMFNGLAAGTFSLRVEDANACATTGIATVALRNNKPEPNFLAATKNYALDTLVLTEISIPKPDSLRWQFDPRAQIIDPNPAAPRIRFAQEGEYPVSMTSYFGNCGYTVTKVLNLRPYDPNRKPDNLPGVRPIEEFTVSPNPTTGEFSIYVRLNRQRNLSVILFDATGTVLFNQRFEEVKEVTLPGSLANAAAGLYIVRAITEAEAQEIRLIVNR